MFQQRHYLVIALAILGRLWPLQVGQETNMAGKLAQTHMTNPLTGGAQADSL